MAMHQSSVSGWLAGWQNGAAAKGVGTSFCKRNKNIYLLRNSNYGSVASVWYVNWKRRGGKSCVYPVFSGTISQQGRNAFVFIDVSDGERLSLRIDLEVSLQDVAYMLLGAFKR